MIECHLRTNLPYRIAGILVPLVIAIAMLACGILMVLGVIRAEPGVGWLVLAGGAILAYTASSFLRLPRTIELHDDGKLVFRGLGKPKVISAQDVRSIEPLRGVVGMLVVHHSGGKLALVNQFTGFHRLLSALEDLNSKIEIKGC